MFRLHFSDYRARLHRFFLLIVAYFIQSTMFLKKTESFKWIRKRFAFRTATNNSHSSNSSTSTASNQLTSVEDGKHVAATTTTTATTKTTIASNDIKSLHQVLVVTDTTTATTATATATATTKSDTLHLAGSAADTDLEGNEAATGVVFGRYGNRNNNNNHNGNTMPHNNNNNNSNTCSHAPIARLEDGDMEDDSKDESLKNHYNTAPVDAITALHRSKSRVRTYLRRFQERLTGHHHQHPVTLQPSVSRTNVLDVENQLAAVAVAELHFETLQVDRLAMLARADEDDDCFSTAFSVVDEDDNASYEDIDFGLSTPSIIVPKSNNIKCALLAEIDARQAEMQHQQAMRELESAQAVQRELELAALIDTHLADIYPVYHEHTRAILIREARDLLCSQYEGSLEAFEILFLAKYAEIAAELKRKHAIGECITWCEGWPLATLAGEVILHLGALDATLVAPAEFYLCIKTVANSSPQLYAVWRSTHSEDSDSTLQSRCLDHSDPQAYLSILNLETMLSDDLPQLLQNLLVGVERAIGRLSVNELTLPGVLVGQQAALDATNNNNNSNNKQNANNITNNNNYNKNLIANAALASPKCSLKRSELITKNKMLNNKFMLRRLTNRQDSMTSTSSGNSCSSTGSTGSSSSDELLSKGVPSLTSSGTGHNGTTASVSPALPLFCLGNSFPHIDSDEENADEKRNSLEFDNSLSQEIVAPRAICEIPEKLLTSGIYLPGTRDLKGRSIVTIDADCLLNSGLNCYEIATVLLYYSTIPESISEVNGGNNLAQQQHVAAVVLQQPAQQQKTAFTILITIDLASHLNAIDLICQSLKLLARHIEFCEILAICQDRSLLLLSKQRAAETPTTNWQCDKQQQQQQPTQQPPATLPQPSLHLVKFISVDEVTTSVAPNQLPSGKLHGLHHHDPRKWREFFALLEPFQSQCMATGQRLVTAMNEIRCADMQGLPTRRQLYAQHRALSRALMDSELHNVRKRGAQTLTRLQELAKNINSTVASSSNSNSGYSYNSSHRSSSAVSSTATATTIQNLLNSTNNNNNGHNIINSFAVAGSQHPNVDVAIRLNKVTLLFNEVDRAAKRLEQLTEQRRERLRELTRQRALEDEINEVTSWITSDGNETLQRFSNLQLDCETDFKEHEHEFEKYYFISMKHLAKGRDLHEAAADIDALHESAANLKTALDAFAEKLELARERIEGAARLHQLLSSNAHVDEELRQEMQRLAEKIGLGSLLEKHCELLLDSNGNGGGSGSGNGNGNGNGASRTKPNSLNLQFNLNLSCSRANTNGTNQTKANAMLTSTPVSKQQSSKSNASLSASGIGSGSGSGSGSEAHACHCWRESRNVEDVDAMLEEQDLMDKEVEEEEQSKIADSGLGGCERCEGNPKLSRICSCQSLNEAGNLYDKGHNSDELDDECFERPSKRFLNIHSPMEANSHLQCYAFNMELPEMEELSCLEPKIQKTLLLIMREMIGTERDYVRSLYYVIENYVDELLRDDIPQPLRGQRNVIFGNIEKIFEFHNSHFLCELERYEHNPLKVGAAFLEMESKFYLYALYNKNKPKSDTLMSEYGTTFFKSKQLELTDKMDLASYLLKPVQRMGKYALLLQQLVKACSSVEGDALQEILADVEELQRAEEMVKFQLRHGNDLLAMDSLRDCDVNVKEQGRLMRQNEFLVWQGRGGKKTLRQIFLFEELVLFSKARRFPDHKNLDIYIYKNSIKTSDIGLTAHVGESPTKFEIWFRKRKPEDTWTLQCMSEDIKNAWTEEISKLLWKQAKRNRDIRLAEMSSMGIGSKPCLDIRPSNNQISDRSITITQLGKAPKLRHSFVNMHAEHNKTSKRPNSLISESSISSGTSSSSTSTGSSSFSGSKQGHNHHHHGGLELINETQALMLAAAAETAHNNNNNTNTMSSSSSSAASGGPQQRNHKRSTTLVSQLSMESGIMSDISMTPEQEQTPDASSSWSTAGVIMRKKHYYAKQTQQQQNAENKEQLKFEVSQQDEPFILEPTTKF